MVFATGIMDVSFMLVTAYVLFYLFASLKRILPWVGCENEWNTIFCSEIYTKCIAISGVIVANGSCVNPDWLKPQELLSYGVEQIPSGAYNFSKYKDPFHGKRVRPSEEYWK